MSKVLEYNGKLAFHPGYYIEELVEESGLTQDEFSHRLGTTAKNLSVLINGKQKLSFDIAYKLSKMYGTSVKYWMNLQTAYDLAEYEIQNEKTIKDEQDIVKELGYSNFRDSYGLPGLPRNLSEQVKVLCKFFNISSLTKLRDPSLAVSFRSAANDQRKISIVKANAMVQIAVNEALKIYIPPFDKNAFKEAVKVAQTLTGMPEGCYKVLSETFLKAGVKLVILKSIPGSKINGATRKIGNSVLLMVSDRYKSADIFWFTLFHEVGHIMNDDFGASFEGDKGSKEESADKYAADCLIPADDYIEFLKKDQITPQSIEAFARKIGRDPSIIVGRLSKEGKIAYQDRRYESYKKSISFDLN